MNYKRKILNGILIGMISAFIVLLDTLFCSIYFPGKLFAWISFVSWTFFLISKEKDLSKTIVGYVIGILIAIAIIKYGDFLFSVFPLSVNGQSQTSFIATFLFISFIMLCYEFKLLYTSITSVFIGMFIVFSGLGYDMQPLDLKNSIIMILIIIAYSIIGLFAGQLSIELHDKDNKKSS